VCHPVANGTVSVCARAPSWYRKRMEPSLQPRMTWLAAAIRQFTPDPTS